MPSIHRARHDGRLLALFWALTREHPQGVYVPLHVWRVAWGEALGRLPHTFRPKDVDGLVSQRLIEPVGRDGWLVHAPPDDLPRPAELEPRDDDPPGQGAALAAP